MEPHLFLLNSVELFILVVLINNVSAEYEYKFRTYERNESLLRNNLTQSLVHLLRSHKGVKEFRIEDGRFKVNTVQRNRIRSRSSVSRPSLADSSTDQIIAIYDEPDFRTDDYSSQESPDRLYTKRAAPQDQYETIQLQAYGFPSEDISMKISTNYSENNYNTRVFTMNDTTPPLDTKRPKLFFNHKPDTETGNAIYRSVLSVHNTSDLHPSTDLPTHSTQPLTDQVYRRYFKDISQRQLKNIQDMIYPKQDMKPPNTNIYKLFKIEAVKKDPYLDQGSQYIQKNESEVNAFKQTDYGQNDTKLFSVQLNKKSPNNESDSNTNQSYFVSYLSDIIPAIEQQIKNGVVNFIEQSNSKTSKLDDQAHRYENSETTTYKTEPKDDIRYALVKTLNDVYKQYEDVRKIYKVILKIHAEIINVKNDINSKLTSVLSSESSIAEKHNVLSRLEKDLMLKQEVFMVKQNEFYKTQKGFNEKQREFQAMQVKMAKNDQSILQRQKEISNQQSEIAKKQQFLTTYLKHYISKLNDSPHLENDEVVPVAPTFWHPPSAYKVTPLHPVTADKIQQIIKSNLENSDNPTAFLIKIKNRVTDDGTGNSNLNARFVERTVESSAMQKDIDDLVYRFYFKNSTLDKIMNPNKGYQLEGMINLVPENIIKLLKQKHYPAGLHDDGLRKALSAQEDLPKRFKKDRRKRSLEHIECGHNNTYLKLRMLRLIRGKKHENVTEKTIFPVGKPTIANLQSEKMNALELVQGYCNAIDQNRNGFVFKHCVDKFLSQNQAEDLNPPETLNPLGLTSGSVSSHVSPAGRKTFKQKN